MSAYADALENKFFNWKLRRLARKRYFSKLMRGKGYSIRTKNTRMRKWKWVEL